MDSQLFYTINLVAAIFLLLWFLSARRGGSKTSSLNLKKGSFYDESSEATENLIQMQQKQTFQQKPQVQQSYPPPQVSKQKVLNVLFMYNGHDWDAYEVLGLPAGCGINLVTQRYQELIRNVEAGQLQFYQAAYDAILKKQ